MRKVFAKKSVRFLVLFTGLVSLILLANSLTTIDFRSGQSFGRATGEEPAVLVNLSRLVETAEEVSLLDQLVFLGLSFIVLLLVSALLSPELRRKLLRAFLRFAVLVLAFFYLVQERPDLLLGILNQFNKLGPAVQVEKDSGGLIPVFTPPQETEWLSYFLGFILVVGFLLFVWRLLRTTVFGRKSPNSSLQFRQIAGIIRTSLGKLDSGQDFEDFIIECYARMSAALGKRKSLFRPSGMTPREFASHLILAGLPPEPVNGLTRVFERVRYGDYHAEQIDIDQARLDLVSILDFCGEVA
ncbi:MAG: DUF4129 domain-containing protein [Chloroflexi bacterium]|nr:DUF4129 domain-containing protein [Chloroflexota bacterium]